ncbi:NADH dehydrogenase (quinone) [Thermosphaera aggregans DSM 11486]|uniref:NADH dehydrogenase (Quinone) n=2 Tax=Thermosphaera aggregans TaxID=54254 RepID=D5U2E5_THEAM|nr:NADH dehydrogenase (quinone) [Thermosphaera aggregans DSM 11486]
MLGSVNLMGYPSILPALTPYLLVFGAFTLVFFKLLNAGKVFSRIYAFAYVLTSLVFSVSTYLMVRDSGILYYELGGFPPPIGITYVVDEFSAFLGVIVTGLALLLYPLIFVLQPRSDEYYLALYLGLLAGFTGVLYTGDLFNMFVMMEVMLVSTYGLVALAGSKQSYKSAFDYAMIAGVGGLLFFAGAVLIYFATGTLSLGHMGLIEQGFNTCFKGLSEKPVEALQILSLLLFWGLVVDEALVPLHFWLPPAYSSAGPVTASLLAGASEGVAYYALARIVYTVLNGLNPILEYSLRILGTASILVGGVGALYSRSLSQTISYTVVMDSGYMAIALSLGPAGLNVALAYILAHSIVKPLLFLIAGWVKGAYGTDLFDKVEGSLRSSKVLQAGLVTGAAAVTGLPPTIFFIAKLGVYVNLFNALNGDLTIPLALFTSLVGSLLALTAFLKAVSALVLSPPGEGWKPVPTILKAYLVLFTVLTILLGIVYAFTIGPVVSSASNSIVAGRSDYLSTVSGILFCRGGSA